jgi:hypothetical protein
VGGNKLDDGKVMMDLIPPEALWAIGRVLTFGAKKYGRRNWEKGLAFDQVYAACERHIQAYRNGEVVDPETGESHLAHFLTEAVFLVTLEERGLFSAEKP